jgi:hypothetical protein
VIFSLFSSSHYLRRIWLDAAVIAIKLAMIANR